MHDRCDVIVMDGGGGGGGRQMTGADAGRLLLQADC